LHASRYFSSPVLAAGRVYLTARDGAVSVVRTGRRYELLAVNTLGDNFTASPAVVGNRLYLRGFPSLYAFGAGNEDPRGVGAIAWDRVFSSTTSQARITHPLERHLFKAVVQVVRRFRAAQQEVAVGPEERSDLGQDLLFGRGVEVDQHIAK